MLPGSDGHPRAAAHTAIPQPAGAPDGADENQDQHAADGSWSELQQTKAPQGRLFPRTIGQQPRQQNGGCSDPIPTARSLTVERVERLINESLCSLLRQCWETVVRLRGAATFHRSWSLHPQTRSTLRSRHRKESGSYHDQVQFALRIPLMKKALTTNVHAAR